MGNLYACLTTAGIGSTAKRSRVAHTHQNKNARYGCYAIAGVFLINCDYRGITTPNNPLTKIYRGSDSEYSSPRMARPDFGMQATGWRCSYKISCLICSNQLPKVYWFLQNCHFMSFNRLMIPRGNLVIMRFRGLQQVGWHCQ